MKNNRLHIFFSGIGGSGVSAIAAFMADKGHIISGSDRAFEKNPSHPACVTLKNKVVTILPQDGYFGDGYRLRYYLIYQKGACLLYRIHKDLGDHEFVRFLRSYLKTFKGRVSTTAHVPMVIKSLTGKDYTKFFDDYYWGLEMPPKK